MAKYVGKRVVPKHCGAWTKNKEYEMLSIVLDEASGESYISRRVVPAGTLLTDEYYWSICSLFSQQIADMGEVERNSEDEDIRIVKQIKNSLAAKGNDLRFEIRSDTGFRWLEAEENNAAVGTDSVFTELPKNKHELGAILLKKALADGPVESNEIKKLMVQYRIGDKTLNEVKNSLGIKPFRKMRVWYWALPGNDNPGRKE